MNFKLTASDDRRFYCLVRACHFNTLNPWLRLISIGIARYIGNGEYVFWEFYNEMEPAVLLIMKRKKFAKLEARKVTGLK